MSTPARVSDFFAGESRFETNHSWQSLSFAGAAGSEQELVSLLAAKIMAYRCRANTSRFDAWDELRRGGEEPNETTRQALRVIVQSGLGLPDHPRPADHVQAFVAEHLWYFLLLEAAPDQLVIRLEGPSVETTETGGDGLAIHRKDDSSLIFRLWEIKKYYGTRDMKRTVTRACQQLTKHAERYLNKYSLLGQYESDQDVRRLYGQLLDHWIEATDKAAVGVSVGTSTSSVQAKSFGALPVRFPLLLAPRRLEGIVKAVEDFAAFSAGVRDEIWKGL